VWPHREIQKVGGHARWAFVIKFKSTPFIEDLRRKSYNQVARAEVRESFFMPSQCPELGLFSRPKPKSISQIFHSNNQRLVLQPPSFRNSRVRRSRSKGICCGDGQEDGGARPLVLEENEWVGRGWGKYMDKVGGNKSRHSCQQWENTPKGGKGLRVRTSRRALQNSRPGGATFPH
jgi:hypothetical protein